MNIKELIKKYELLKNNGNLNAVAITEIINDLKRLKVSQEVEIPQFVGNYITFAKENGWDIEKAMCHVVDEDGDELRLWFYKDNNQVLRKLVKQVSSQNVNIILLYQRFKHFMVHTMECFFDNF